MPAAVLEAIGVSKTYGEDVQALVDVSLAVREGETVALIGESGSGKSTLLRLCNRLETPDYGALRFEGDDLETVDPIALRRAIGYVQQEGGLLPHWTVARNVCLVPALLGWERRRQEERATELLELVGLEAERYAGRYPIELSGGQRQRVAFARALAADPDVVLLDEPFGSLDALTRVDLQNEFLRLKNELAKTFLFVTHDLREALRLADRIAVLRQGRLLQIDSPAALVERPADPYIEDLLRASGAVA